MAAPTFVQEVETSWTTDADTTASVTTASFSVQAGDILVAAACRANYIATKLTISDSTGLTWTERQSDTVANYTGTTVWTATVASSGSMTVTVGRGNDPGSAEFYGIAVQTWRGSDGIGASAKANASGATPSCAITTTQADSALVVFSGDWNATSGARTARTISGASFTETAYAFDAAQYMVVGGYYDNVGAIGSKTTGWTAPTGQKYAMVVVEVKGAASSDATVNLTGQSATVSAGSLSEAISYALSGQGATSSAGNLKSAIAQAITGQAATSASGTLVASLSQALTGLEATGSAGTLTADTATDVSVSLSGLSATVSAGTLFSALSQALTGSAATTSAGTLKSALSQPISGQAATASAGTLAQTVSYALSGQALTSAQGTISVQAGADVSVSLSGEVVSISAGTLKSAAAYSLTGASASVVAGSATVAVSQALSGVSATVSAGTVSASVSGDVSVALSGQSVTISQGDITVLGGDSRGVGGYDKPRKRRWLVKVGEQTLEVGSLQQASDLLAKVRREVVAEPQKEAKAPQKAQIVERPTEPTKAEVKVEAAIQRQISVYNDAIEAVLRELQEQDEEEALLLLL